jgi:hypothetical protein
MEGRIKELSTQNEALRAESDEHRMDLDRAMVVANEFKSENRMLREDNLQLRECHKTRVASVVEADLGDSSSSLNIHVCE